MRITYLTVFVVTLFVAWVCFAGTGDFNLYVVYPDKKVIKDHVTVLGRFFWGGLYALTLAVANTGALWIWQCVRKLHLKTKRIALLSTLLIVSLAIGGLYKVAHMPYRAPNTFFGALELQVLWTWVALLASGWLGILIWFVFTFVHKNGEGIA